MKLLLVEDEEVLSAALSQGLCKRGYAVDCAFDGEDALNLYEVNEYDLIILDLNLPKIDGMEVLRQIREKDKELRVLILSARNTVKDKINGLDSGSNDYLTKPFDFMELEARIRNLLRQTVYVKNTVLSCGELQIDTAAKIATIMGLPLGLTKKEYSILEYLMIHQGRLISLEEIIEHVWDSDTDLFSNSFRVHMSSLRKKIDAESGDVQYISTLRGQGYLLSASKEVYS